MTIQISGGRAVAQSLIDNGVRTVFAIPGIQLDHLFNAFYDLRDKIRVVHCRHEQAAGYMALGYAAATGRPGVCAVVPGPGLLNAATALATAYAVNAPVLCIAGQIPSQAIGKGFGLLHELPDQLAIAKGITKWAARIETPADVPRVIAAGFRQLMGGRRGPVELEIAMDQLARVQAVDLHFEGEEPSPPRLDLTAVERAATILAKASNPLIMVGGGGAEAGAQLKRIAEMLRAPVSAFRSGQGILDGRHPLSINQAVAHRYWPRVDVVLGVGSRLIQARQWGTDDRMQIIRLDIDPGRIGEGQMGIVGDAKDSLKALADALHNKRRSPYGSPGTADIEALKQEIKGELAVLEPQLSYLRAIREALPEDGIFVEELTQLGYVARLAFPVYAPRTYLTPGYQGTLGYGFPTALGAKIACPEKKVLAISGDGGFMFCIGELATAAQHDIGVVAVVFSNDAFGNVQRMQRDLHSGRVIATDLRNPDFVKLAESFGVRGYRAETPEQLRETITKAFAQNGPTVIEVPMGDTPDPWRWLLPSKVR